MNDKLKPEAKQLRDEFAAAAITGLALQDLTYPERVAARAWKLADLMLQERDKKPEAK